MFEDRIRNLQKSLGKNDLESFLITSPYNISYLTGISAFSIEEREAHIFVTPKKIYLFTDARYTEMASTNSPFVTLIEVNYKNPLSKSLNKILKEEKIGQIGFEEEHITYAEALVFEEKIDADLLPIREVVEKLREAKDKEEILKIKKTCALTDKGFNFILPHLKEGVTEIEIKLKLENYFRVNGGSLSFESIIAFGKNASIPHHVSGNTKLKKNETILMDFGAKLDNYCSDMTRTVFLGKPEEKIEKMYLATQKAQIEALKYIEKHTEKGFQTKKAAIIANKVLEKNSFPHVPHGLGHGVGLQVHENPSISPFSSEKLMEGNIITVEPGIYLPGLSGIRIEDTVLITKNGIEILTKSTKEMIVL